jgi:protein-tyrosine phosphatase
MKTHLQKPFDRCYWVVPNKFLAGEYPGSKDSREALGKVSGLVNCGIRRIINLMEENETNFANERFVSYEEVLHAVSDNFGMNVKVTRHPIKDLHVPSVREIIQILDSIDQSIDEGLPVYVHCWGGVGRTGTVVGCYLIRHDMVTQRDVLDRIAFLRREELTSYRQSPETAVQRRMVQNWKAGQ